MTALKFKQGLHVDQQKTEKQNTANKTKTCNHSHCEIVPLCILAGT